MLVGAPVGASHMQAVLANCLRVFFALAHNLFILDIAGLRLARRAAPRGDGNDVQCIRQAISHEIDVVPALHAAAGRSAFAVDAYVPSGYRGTRTATGLKEPAEEQPAIDAQ